MHITPVLDTLSRKDSFAWHLPCPCTAQVPMVWKKPPHTPPLSQGQEVMLSLFSSQRRRTIKRPHGWAFQGWTKVGVANMFHHVVNAYLLIKASSIVLRGHAHMAEEENVSRLIRHVCCGCGWQGEGSLTMCLLFWD